MSFEQAGRTPRPLSLSDQIVTILHLRPSRFERTAIAEYAVHFAQALVDQFQPLADLLETLAQPFFQSGLQLSQIFGNST